MPHETSRRRFLASLGEAGAGLAAGSWLDVIGYAQAGSGSARAVIEPLRASGAFDRRLLGSFLEHLGRAIYTGIYQPGSTLADARGFRIDVVREIKALGVPIVRYPGGNFVSGYNWLDGVGPKAQRPTVLDRAWNSLETNQFGTNDFIDWCRLVGTEPLLGMNFGTGTAETAVAYVEYCNLERGTKWSDLRRSHGYEQPHNVRYWCLGNEMDGPWQIGQMQAREYGRKARDVAKQMRVIDAGVQLIACGSSGTGMPTYLVWDREVLEECYDQVDGISLHAYYGNTRALTGNGTARYLAMNLDMDRQIREIAAVCDYVQAIRRSSKRLWLSFDEWNVWYRARSGPATDGRPRRRAETARGGLQPRGRATRRRVRQHAAPERRARPRRLPRAARQRHRAARHERCRRAPAEHLLPVRVGLQYARGQVLDLRVESQTYPIAAAGLQADFARNEQVPYVDVVATQDPQNGQACVLMLNRDLDGERELQLEWRDATPTRVLACETLTGPDLQAFNTFEQPRRVGPQRLDAPAPGARMTFRLPARSIQSPTSRRLSHELAHLRTRWHAAADASRPAALLVGRSTPGIFLPRASRMRSAPSVRHRNYEMDHFVAGASRGGLRGLSRPVGRRGLRNPEVAQRGRRDAPLGRDRQLRNPAVRNAVRPVDGVGRIGAGEGRIHVLPDDRAFPGDLEHPPWGAGCDEGVAVRQPLRAADIGAEESGVRVRPDQFERHRVDFEHARRRPGKGPPALRRDRVGEAVATRSAVVEHQQMPGARQAFRNQVRVVLADDLADRAKLLRLAEVGTEPPDDRAVAADDGEEARFAAADEDVVRGEAPVALVEPAVRADVGRRVDVEPVEAATGAVEGRRQP